MARRVERYEVRLHATRVVYRRAGSGPTLLMIHGLAQESSTWELLNEYLGENADLICPDLPGHGDSEPPQGDHSLGAFASTMRDLLLALDRPPSSGIRSGAASRCSSPTSSPRWWTGSS